VISHAVSVEKPHHRIFEEAARKARASPGALLMVGDSWEHDIVPVLELGWRAVWLRSGDDPLPAAQSRYLGTQVLIARDFGEILGRVQAQRWVTPG
jgi:FMN phosphatase YigB (HAD superfamily)